MPDTPNYAISFPCEGNVITPAVFSDFALDIEAAIATVSTAGTAVTHTPMARASGITPNNPGVETVVTTTAATSYASGITLNPAAGTFTIVKPGLYNAEGSVYQLQSSLTMTSQRLAVAVNGVNVVAKKYHGSNPADITTLGGSFSAPIYVVAGDVVTFRYLWTGTGVLGFNGNWICLSMLTTP